MEELFMKKLIFSFIFAASPLGVSCNLLSQELSLAEVKSILNKTPLEIAQGEFQEFLHELYQKFTSGCYYSDDIDTKNLYPFNMTRSELAFISSVCSDQYFDTFIDGFMDSIARNDRDAIQKVLCYYPRDDMKQRKLTMFLHITYIRSLISRLTNTGQAIIMREGSMENNCGRGLGIHHASYYICEQIMLLALCNNDVPGAKEAAEFLMDEIYNVNSNDIPASFKNLKLVAPRE